MSHYFYLGIDVGASKTHALLANDQGNIVAEAVEKGANLHNTSIDEILDRLYQTITIAFSQLNNESRNDQPIIINACMGMSGLDTQADGQKLSQNFQQHPSMQKLFAQTKVMVVNDSYIGFKSGTDLDQGTCIIAGTGSNCYGLDDHGNEARAGDWGFLLGDLYSGFSIGQAMLRQVMQEFDHRETKTPLTTVVLEHLGLSSPIDLINWAYQEQHVQVRTIASLANRMQDDRIANLPFIRSQIDRVASELTRAYQAVIKQLDFSKLESIPVVLIGGLFNTPAIFSEVESRLCSLTSNLQLIRPQHTPTHGALKLAINNFQSPLPPSVVWLNDSTPTGLTELTRG